jgi:hypothetical protein
VRLEEVCWLVKKDGLSEIRRAQDDPQLKRYMEDGDRMGNLWKQGFGTWFMDHAPLISAAVRASMLDSHSSVDVINDL